MVAASARVLLASVRRNWAVRRGVCQKIDSQYVDLVVEWRDKAVVSASPGADDRNRGGSSKPAGGTVSLFPVWYFRIGH